MLRLCLLVVLCTSWSEAVPTANVARDKRTPQAQEISNPEPLPPTNPQTDLNPNEDRSREVKRQPRHNQEASSGPAEGDRLLTQSPLPETDPKTHGNLLGALGALKPQPTSYNVAPATYVHALPPSKPIFVNSGCSSCASPPPPPVCSHTYTATVPFIAGYRLVPVLSRKQITINDWHPGSTPCQEAVPTCGYSNQHVVHPTEVVHTLEPPSHSPLPLSTYPVGGQLDYAEHTGGLDHNGCSYSTGGLQCPPFSHRQAVPPPSWDPEQFLQPFEQSGFFVPPTPQPSETAFRQPTYYQDKIEDLRNNIEHLESVRNAAAQDNNRQVE